MATEHAYWLFKKLSSDFSIDKLSIKGQNHILWTGVRDTEDTQALKRGVRRGDVILFCTVGEEPAVVAVLEAIGDPIPDATAWDVGYSGKHWVTPPDRLMPGCSIASNPFWAVEVRLVGGPARCSVDSMTAQRLCMVVGRPTCPQVARLQAVRLEDLLRAHPCWATDPDIANPKRTVLPVSEEQWDAVIDMSQQRA